MAEPIPIKRTPIPSHEDIAPEVRAAAQSLHALSGRICIIHGCESKVFGRGWCNAHYKRWWRYGDPLLGRTAEGDPQKYLHDVVLIYDGDDCLTWPFGRSSAGYGLLSQHGQMALVSRMVCEAANGPPPSSNHHAAHSCGLGHTGCVAKRHLSWKTPRENAADKITHGTAILGEDSPNAKLKVSQVIEIRQLRGRMSQGDIGDLFGISSSHVCAIQMRRAWRHVA